VANSDRDRAGKDELSLPTAWVGDHAGMGRLLADSTTLWQLSHALIEPG
jgi:hypothetical protein